MTKFNNEYFGKIVDFYVNKKGSFDGTRVTSKTQMYMMIGEACHKSPETVRAWRKSTSSGPDPKDLQVLKDLEKYLGLEEGGLLIETDEFVTDVEVEKENKMMTLTDFQKAQVYELYLELRQFVTDMQIEDENQYYCLRHSVELRKIILPDDIYQAFIRFLEDVLETYVFSDLALRLTSDDNVENIAQFFKLLRSLEEKIEKFAEENLKQYLICN